MQLELLIFDWDGTLADSAGKIISAMQSAFANIGLVEPSPDHIRAIIGLSLGESIFRLAPTCDSNVRASLENEYRREFSLHREVTQLFKGGVEILEHFHTAGIALAVATGKSANGLQQALEETGTARYFTSLRTADDCASKPSPEMLEEILLETGFNKENAIMVGDTTFDMEMADNAKIASVAACYGAHHRTLLTKYSPLYFIDDVCELAEKLTID